MEKAKILIAENVNSVAVNIKDKLIEFGYIVQAIVPSGDKALAEIEIEKPDLVIMDTRLKRQMSGISAANIIKEDFNIPVIFLTTDTDSETIIEAKKTGAYGYLLKPYRDAELFASIEIALSKADEFFTLAKENDYYKSNVSPQEIRDYIFIRTEYKLIKIKLNEICFIEALKDYVSIHTIENEYTTHATMKQVINFLPAKYFSRIHRSFIVRIDKILSIKYPDCHIEGKKSVITIGGLYRKDLYKKLNIL